MLLEHLISKYDYSRLTGLGENLTHGDEIQRNVCLAKGLEPSQKRKKVGGVKGGGAPEFTPPGCVPTYLSCCMLFKHVSRETRHLAAIKKHGKDVKLLFGRSCFYTVRSTIIM